MVNLSAFTHISAIAEIIQKEGRKMAMAQIAYQTILYLHIGGKSFQKAEMPLFQAFLRLFCLKTIDGHCIKENTTIDMARGTDGMSAFFLPG